MKNELNAPAGVSAVATGPQVNRIEFSGEDGLTYEIWRRHGDTVDWYLHTTVAEGAFDDPGVTPGQYYEYKVRAIRGEEASDFSESVVVYGKA